MFISYGGAQNHALSLDGDGDYVRLPSDIFNELDEVTIEGWVRWEKFSFMARFFDFAAEERYIAVHCIAGTGSLWFALLDENSVSHFINVEGILSEGTWFHIAGVLGKGGMKLYLNGVLVGNPVAGLYRVADEPGSFLGMDNNPEERPTLNGQLDEVRIWGIARTEAQIRSTMRTPLQGDEPGLVGYWKFEGEGDKVIDATGNGHDGQISGHAARVVSELSSRVQKPAVVWGVVQNEKRTPVSGAHVYLQRDTEILTETYTSTDGHYSLATFAEGEFDLYATQGANGALQENISLVEGDRRQIALTLKEAVSIKGTLMTFHSTPHVAVPVQAVSEGKVIATTLSDEGGNYQFISLRPGPYQVRCYTLGRYVYYAENGNTVVEPSHATSLQLKRDKTLSDIGFHFAPFKKGRWKTYTFLDGLAHNIVTSIHRDPDGVMWFGTGGGVSRYDGNTFTKFTTEDGLADNSVMAIHRDPDGVMWFATYGGGISRYDGKVFANLTIENGLAHNKVWAIYRNPDGVMWFGTEGGVSRYNGKEFANFTTRDGLAHNVVSTIYQDATGVLWFGTGGGISRYDGEKFVNFTTKDGLANSAINAIYGDPDGVMWFGTQGGGVSRYDGKVFVNFTTKDGLANDYVWTIHRNPDGVMWFGTIGGGVSRYDGEGFANFTTADGLAYDRVTAIHQDPDGVVWFGTFGGGLSRYDGKTFVNFAAEDGLADGEVRAIAGDQNEGMWFGTFGGGVSRYDGRVFVNFTTKEGLAGNRVLAIHRAHDGIMWFGTLGRGVSRYNGEEFVNFTTKDGLVNNTVYAIHRDPDGVIWFGTGA